MQLTSSRIISGRRVGAVLALVVACSTASLAHAAEQYAISQLGLYDASPTAISHMGLNGVTNESITFVGASGVVVGTAQRYKNSTSTSTIGINSFYYDPSTQTNNIIGLVTPYSSTAPSNTEADGAQGSTVRFLSSTGIAVGTSAIYNSTANATGGSAFLGNTTFLYTPGGTSVQIGLFDTETSGVEHVKSTGSIANSPAAMNTSGVVVGNSSRYDATYAYSEGQDAWLYNPATGTTTAIGLTGGIYSNTAGSDPENQVSTIVLLNNNGQAAGYASKFDGTSGNQAFVYDPSTGTTPVGLANGTYNYYSSLINSASKINNTLVTGTCTTSTYAGTTAFVYNFASKTTTPVALDFTQTPAGANGTLSYTGTSNTTFSSSISAINNAGQAIGSQTLYLSSTGASPGTSAGSDAFFFDGTNTVPIGLTDAAHTANPAASVFNGHYYSYVARSNSASYLNDAGQVAGSATLYTQTTAANGTVSSTSIGSNAWVYTAAAGTHIIGLTSSLYTSATTGGQSSTVNFQNASSLIVGTSTRYYSNGTSAGSDAYLYTPGANGTYGTNSVIGLTDALHTSFDGVNKGTTSVFGIDAIGLVAGTSQRFVSGSNTTNGQDAWVYNTNSGTTYQITLSSNTTNYAYSTVQYLGDNGVVLGSYNNYASNGTLLGTYAYAFEGGQAYDLGVNTTNFTAAGWTKLASTFSEDLAGDIAGTGTISNGTITYTSLYVLSVNGLLGDANGDGKVDLSDLNIVLNNLGTTSSLRSNGNFDGAATIDLTDLNDVLNNLGTSLTTNISVGAVPEPASLGLLAAGGAVLAASRRRRQN